MYQVQDLKKTVKSQRKELNDCRAEITSLKMLIDGARSGKIVLATDSTPVQSITESHSDNVKLLSNEVEMSEANTSMNASSTESVKREEGKVGEIEAFEEEQVNDSETAAIGPLADGITADMQGNQCSDDTTSITETVLEDLMTSLGDSGLAGKSGDFSKDNGKPSSEMDSLSTKLEKFDAELNTEKMVKFFFLFGTC